MDPNTVKLPSQARLAMTLLSICLIIALLYVGRQIITPILLSLLFAILLQPVVAFLNKKIKIPNVIAVLLSVAIFVCLIGTIIYFISWQVSDLVNDFGKIKKNLSIHLWHIEKWIKDIFHISYHKQEQYVQEIAQDSFSIGNGFMGSTLSSFTGTLIDILLIPIYTFLILLYRKLFVNFLLKLTGPKHDALLVEILCQIKTVVQSFITGLLIEMVLVSIMTTTGLMIIGVQYAILLGVISAIFNLIPYIGIIVAALITMVVALSNTTDFSVVAGVIIVNIIVQFIDNNILVPRIVGNKVRINALVSIVGVIIGGTLGGIAGMFLAIPTIAITKVIFDRIDSLKPWGFLMGDDLSKTYTWKRIILTDLNPDKDESAPEADAQKKIIVNPDGMNDVVNKEK